MLYYSTIDPPTLDLLKALQAAPEFTGMRLVGATFMVLKSLTYFDDAEGDPMPAMLHNIEWNEVKGKISMAVENYL